MNHCPPHSAPREQRGMSDSGGGGARNGYGVTRPCSLRKKRKRTREKGIPFSRKKKKPPGAKADQATVQDLKELGTIASDNRLDIYERDGSRCPYCGFDGASFETWSFL